MGELLLDQKMIKIALMPELGLAIKQSPPSWSSTASFQPGEGDTQLSRELVWEHLRRAERGGSDVRLDTNVPFRPKAWPRASVNPNMWHCSICNG